MSITRRAVLFGVLAATLVASGLTGVVAIDAGYQHGMAVTTS